MYRKNKIAVVVPAYNEERFICKVLDTIPAYVDRIIVVDDKSTDNTYKVAESHADNRTLLIKHHQNKGVGGAIITGHKKAIELDADISVVIAGDGQMDPQYLSKLLDAIIHEGYDYAKGNRFLDRGSREGMPNLRIMGNILLTFLTKLSSGYWNIFDPQNGYTAIRVSVLEKLDLGDISKGYEFENDMLVHLNIGNFRVKDVSIPARYGTEKSDIKVHIFIPRTSIILTKRFFRRIKEKYILRNFHPIGLLLASGLILFLWGILFGFYVWYVSLGLPEASTGTVMLSVLPLLLGFQLLLGAFILDIIETPK